MEIPSLEHEEDRRARKLWRAVIAFQTIANAFGIETGYEAIAEPAAETTPIPPELMHAAERANRGARASR